MKGSDIDLADVTKENLSLYLIDIRLPEAVGWWPLAPGWWAMAAGLLLLASCRLFRQARKNQNMALPAQAEQLYAQLQIDGDTAVYCHQISRLLRKAALSSDDREAVVSLHGKQWVQWMEALGECSFSADARELLSDQCYRASARPVTQSVHLELTAWLDKASHSGSTFQKAGKSA